MLLRERKGRVGRQGLSRAQRGVPRWPAAVAILSIGAAYLALSDYVTVGPRVLLPGLMTVLVVLVLSVHALGRYRAARRVSFVLLGVLTRVLRRPRRAELAREPLGELTFARRLRAGQNETSDLRHLR